MDQKMKNNLKYLSLLFPTTLVVVYMKGDKRILVRECKARLGERETPTGPGVRKLSLHGGGMRG